MHRVGFKPTLSKAKRNKWDSNPRQSVHETRALNHYSYQFFHNKMDMDYKFSSSIFYFYYTSITHHHQDHFQILVELTSSPEFLRKSMNFLWTSTTNCLRNHPTAITGKPHSISSEAWWNFSKLSSDGNMSVGVPAFQPATKKSQCQNDVTNMIVIHASLAA